MSFNFPRPPHSSVTDLSSVAWQRWFSEIFRKLYEAAAIAWVQVDKTGSNLTDIQTRNHNDLQTIQGGAANDYYHFTGTQHTDLTDGGQSTLHGHPDNLININSLGTVPDVITVRDFMRHEWSCGVVEGCALTNNGDGTVSIASGAGMFRTTAVEDGELIALPIAAYPNMALTNNAVNYIYADYNAGSPVFAVSTTATAIDELTKTRTYVVAREGTSLYYIDLRNQNVDHSGKHRSELYAAARFRHAEGGSVLGETGTRNITVSAGEFFYGLAHYNHNAYNTSTGDTFVAYYRNGAGGFTKTTGNTQIDNAYYDDGTGTLALLGGSKYGVFWVYLIIDTPTVIAIQYGQNNYPNIASAEAATIPTAPPTLQGLGVLLGRIIIANGAASFTDISSVFSVSFVPSIATSHSGLANLAWTSSAHTGTINTVAGFNGTGVTIEYTLSGTGTALALTNSPTFVTPALGTPSAGVLTSCTGLPLTTGITGILAIGNGGTGQATQQAAIDALTAVSGATNEYVLTKDTATGNAKWKVVSAVVGDGDKGDITVTAGVWAVDPGVITHDKLATAFRKLLAQTNDFRLTLTTGTPVTTADVTGATTIYCCPYTGNSIGLFDGTNWNVRTSAEFSLGLGTITAALPYDIFCYDNAGTPTLEFLAWTNGTTRATALVYQDGVLSKSGAVTRRYLGTFYTTATTTTEDSMANRFLYNYYHRTRRPLSTYDSTSSWTYTTAAYRLANNSTANKFNFVIGVSEDVVSATSKTRSSNTSAGVASVGAIGLDVTNAAATDSVASNVTVYAASATVETIELYSGFPGIGVHYLAKLELSGGSGTTTWYGGVLGRMFGEIWG